MEVDVSSLPRRAFLSLPAFEVKVLGPQARALKFTTSFDLTWVSSNVQPHRPGSNRAKRRTNLLGSNKPKVCLVPRLACKQVTLALEGLPDRVLDLAGWKVRTCDGTELRKKDGVGRVGSGLRR